MPLSTHSAVNWTLRRARGHSCGRSPHKLTWRRHREQRRWCSCSALVRDFDGQCLASMHHLHRPLLCQMGGFRHPLLPPALLPPEGVFLQNVKSVGSTPVQCVDHLVPLCRELFRFSVLGIGAEQESSSLECVCFDHLSRTEWNVTRSG